MNPFQQSANLCGRRIAYPKFSAARPTESSAALTTAPGVDTQDSVCQSFYDDQKVSSASADCKACWQQALDADFKKDEDLGFQACPCILEMDNPCAFIRCVDSEFNKPVSRCGKVYAALTNADDVTDANFKPPFSLADIKDCPKNSSSEGYFSSEKKLNLFLLALFFVVTLFVLYRLLQRMR